MNEVLAIVAWWLCLELIGWAAWPLAATALGHTAGRGAALIKHLGLLVAGYALWLLVSLGFLQNTRISALLAVALVAGLSALALRRERLADLWRAQRGELLRAEVLFLVAFLGYLAFRAYDPAINHTEKPMDFGFLNAILRSPTFPPRDMWLSGYAISYYYFGYLLMALITRLSAVPSGIAYNLALGTVFALTVTGAYGLVRALSDGVAGRRAHLMGLLGAGFVAVLGNLEGVLELLHARGLGSPAFWQWVNIPALSEAPASGGWLPGMDWWWWRATRLIQDVNPFGKLPEVITEFPSFSFILGDLHPHVMALPFGLLVLAVAWGLMAGVRDLPAGAALPLPGGRQWTLPALPRWGALLPLLVGALGFLNSWDLPTYALITIVAYALGRAAHYRRPSLPWLMESAGFAGLLLLGSMALYLPFYAGFRSQAGGLAVVDYTKTRWQHYLLFFGPFLAVIVPWLAAQGLAAARRQRLLGTYGLTLAVVLALPLALMLAVGSVGHAILSAITSLTAGPWLALALALLVALAAALLWTRLRSGGESAGASTFALLLALTGLLLTFGTEFVYIRDSFGTRMNTMFKFYYQAWVLLAASAAYGVGEALQRLRRGEGARRLVSGAWLGAVALLVAGALYYPIAASTSKAGLFRGRPTLDGTAWLDPHSGEGAAIAWLAREAGEDAVILEAPGDEYNASHNRVSAWTGLPTVLGWAGHEGQWRGNYDEVNKRLPDIEAIYQGRDPAEVRALLEKYGVDYVYVGPYERSKYGINTRQTVLDQVMQRVYEADGVVVYGWGA